MHSSNNRRLGVVLAIDSNKAARRKYILFSVLLVIAAAIVTAIRVMPM